MPIEGLPVNTIQQLKSGQVITSVWSSVKELIENSLDAEATSIEVRLDDFGLKKIEVRDNGTGVSKTEVPAMVQQHATSKLSRFDDLPFVMSYGFRGEALSSLCALSDLRIITKTKKDEVGASFEFDKNGACIKSESLAAKQGTIIIATNLFSNLPVRKNYYKELSRKKEELKKVERIVHAFAVINTNVRFSIHHNKSQIFGKVVAQSLLQSYTYTISLAGMGNLDEHWISVDTETKEYNEIQERPPDCCLDVRLLLPRKTKTMYVDMARTSPDKTFVFVNNRPVEMKPIEKLLRTVFSEAANLESEKYPLSVVSITVSGRELEHLDPNLEPNKQKVGIGCLSALLDVLDHFIRVKYKLIEVPQEDDGQQKASEANKESENILSHGAPSTENSLLENAENVENSGLVQCFTVIGHENDAKLSNDSIGREKQISASMAREINISVDSQVSRFFPTQSVDEKAKPAQDQAVMEELGFDDIQPSVEELFQDYERDNHVLPMRNSNSLIPEETIDRHERYRSPVLGKDMFQEPNLPGVDAVYLARLKDGDFSEDVVEQEKLPELLDDAEDTLIGRNRKRLHNPFIEYECEVEGSAKRPKLAEVTKQGDQLSWDGKENHREPQNFNEDPALQFAKGTLIKGSDGAPLQPVLLLQPTRTSEDVVSAGSGPKDQAPKPVFASIKSGLEDLAEASASTGRSSLSLKSRAKPGQTNSSVTPKIDNFLARMDRKREEVQAQVDTSSRKQELPPLRQKRQVVAASFSLSSCRKSALERPEEHESKLQKTPRLLKKLEAANGVGWLYVANSAIHLLSPLRVKEKVIFDRLLASHPLPSCKVDQPIVLYPGHLTQEDLETVRGLYTNTKQCPARITDRRITFNGFDLVIYDYGNDNVTVKLEGRNKDIGFLGVPDLIEILGRIRKSGGVDSVSESRPVKVREHLQREAARLVRDLPPHVPQEELVELMAYKLTRSVTSCPHGKSVSLCLYEEADDGDTSD